jgi:protein deglycase
MKIIVPLAEGFEEIEAVTIIDVLRRAGCDVTSAYVGKNPVRGAHGIAVTADADIQVLKESDFGCIVLPGGMPGSENLKKSGKVVSFIQYLLAKGGYTCAICAAPMVLGHAGALRGRKATCFPGFEPHMTGAVPTGNPVEVDGRVITGKGPGCAIPFALEIARELAGEGKKAELAEAMQVYWLQGRY